MPREVGSEGVDNISGIAWSDIDKVNAINQDAIEKFSGLAVGEEFIWGQESGVYLFTSFQKEPTTDYTNEYDNYGGPQGTSTTPKFGNYPIDDQSVEVGNTLYGLGKVNNGGTTGWLNGSDLFSGSDGQGWDIRYNQDDDITPSGYQSHEDIDLGQTTAAGVLNYRGIPQFGGADGKATSWTAIAATSNGWNMGFVGSSQSPNTGFVDGGSGLSTHETGSAQYELSQSSQVPASNGYSLTATEKSNIRARRTAYIETSSPASDKEFGWLRTPQIDFRTGSVTTDNKMDFYIYSHIQDGLVNTDNNSTAKFFRFAVQYSGQDNPYFLDEDGYTEPKNLYVTYASQSIDRPAADGGSGTEGFGWSINDPTHPANTDVYLLDLSGSIQAGYVGYNKSTDPWIKATVDLSDNNGADFSEGFYLRFLAITPHYTSDVMIDNVKIYGTPS